MNSLKKFWQWVSAGASSTSETSIKNRNFSLHSILTYLIREVTQNAVDAWNLKMKGKDDEFKEKNPAQISFEFDKEESKDLKKWFSGLKEARKTLKDNDVEGYDDDVNYSQVDWLKIVDTNTGGILGDKDDRSSDFWGFLLNWGRSNKRKSSVSTAGSKGVGRISFPLSSKLDALFVVTKRGAKDILLGGFALLTSGNYEKDKDDWKSATAIFAEKENGSVWDLHDEASAFLEDFKIKEFNKKSETGTALIIPFPQNDIKNKESKDRMIAALIDTYAPLIIRNHLVPKVENEKIADKNIVSLTKRVQKYFKYEMEENGEEFISFIRDSIYKLETNTGVVEIDLDEKCDLDNYVLSEEAQEAIDNKIKNEEEILFKINFDLIVNGVKEKTFIEAAFKRPSEDSNGRRKVGVERYFRNGMALIDQPKKLSNTFHSAVLCKENSMSTFLNFFEDDGHTKLIEGNTEKNEALTRGGCDANSYLKALRLYKNCLRDLHKKFVDETEERDESTLAPFFKITKEKKKNVTPSVPTGIVRNKASFKVSEINSGFRIKHVAGEPLPSEIKIKAIYESARELKSSPYKDWDFKFQNMTLSPRNCDIDARDNDLSIKNLKNNFSADITGFDNREPSITFKAIK